MNQMDLTDIYRTFHPNTQVKMDQRPHYQSEHTEPDRRESGKYPITYGHRRSLPMYDPSNTDIKGNIE